MMRVDLSSSSRAVLINGVPSQANVTVYRATGEPTTVLVDGWEPEEPTEVYANNVLVASVGPAALS